MNLLMFGKGYLTLGGVLVNFIGKLISALGYPEVGLVVEEFGEYASVAGGVRKVAGGI